MKIPRRMSGAGRILFFAISFSGQAEVNRFHTGNRADVNPPLKGPAFHLQGGGTDVDKAFQWMFDQVRGCSDCSTKLDVVVLRASGGDGYNEYLAKMNGVDSVETLVITDRGIIFSLSICTPITKSRFLIKGDSLLASMYSISLIPSCRWKCANNRRSM